MTVVMKASEANSHRLGSQASVQALAWIMQGVTIQTHPREGGTPTL